MKKSFQVRLFGNSKKLDKLSSLVNRYRDLVNIGIERLWSREDFKGSYPPREIGATGTKLGCAAIKRAWSITKTAKKLGHNMPVFGGESIDLDVKQCCVRFDASGIFDGWIDFSTLEKFKRITMPFKSHRILNEALKVGKLSKGIILIRRERGWFVQFTVTLPDKSPLATKRVGVDVGVDIAAFTSTGQSYGEELKELRIRTKHRKYRSTQKMPYRQGLNRVAKEIITDHPGCDFAFEQLDFKGKRNRSRLFRSRLQNFACQHLARRMEARGKTEGFRVTMVDPAYTSQTCPSCHAADKRSRCGSTFKCVVCGHEAHADLIGALNINGGKAEALLGDPVGARSRQKPRQEYPGTMGAPPLEDASFTSRINSEMLQKVIDGKTA